MRRFGRLHAFGAVLVAVVLAASCGGDDDTSAGSATTSPPDTDAATTASPAATDAATSASPGATNAATTAAPEEAPVAGGSASWLALTDPLSLDPAKVRGSTAIDNNPAGAIFDRLVLVDAEGKITPRLATSVETDDATTWTITLREGVKFSDGTTFDAAAVKFNWDRMKDQANASPSFATASNMTSIEVVDPLTLKVTLASPNTQWPRYLMTVLGYIGSPTAIEALGPEVETRPVGAGPFMVDEWVRSDHLTLVRNPTYWDAPKPYLDELTFRVVPDNQQRGDSFLAGEGDFVFYVAITPQITVIQDEGYPVFVPEVSGGTGIVFNAAKGPLADKRLRQALLYATDLDDYNQKVLNGAGTPVSTFFLESSPFYDAALVQPTYDLVKAQELVDAYVAENGGPVRIVFPITDTQKITAEIMQQQWSRLENVEIVVEPQAGVEAQRRQIAGEFDVAQSAMYGADPEPMFFDRLHTGSPQNFGDFSDPAMDEALEAGRSAAAMSERKAAYAAAQQVLWDTAPYLLLVRTEWPLAISKKIHGAEPADDGLLNIADIWKD